MTRDEMREAIKERYGGGAQGEAILARVEDVEKFYNNLFPTPARPTTGPGGCPVCHGPTSIAGRRCDECAGL